MPTITSVGTGAWGTAGTWDAGVPVDGDAVIIALGHVVTFNVDQSAFTTGVSVTITGTLTHTTTTGAYTLFAKTGASITGAGTWNIGTSATPIPFAAKHTITGAADWYIDGNAGLTMTVFGAEPSIKYVRLSGAEAAGQTELSVDTDVSADIWADGDTIAIADYNGKDVEERIIAVGGIAAGAITVTVALTNAKIIGAYVPLLTRNIRIIQVGAASRMINRIASGKFSMGGGQITCLNKYIFESVTAPVISGGTFHGYSRGTNFCDSAVISGGVFANGADFMANSSNYTITGGLICGNTNGVYQGGGHVINGGIYTGNTNAWNTLHSGVMLSGSIEGNTIGITASRNIQILGGTIKDNGTGIGSSNINRIANATFSGNTTADINGVAFSAYNTLFSSTTENTGYSALPVQLYSESIDHDQVAGAYRAWTKGGVTTRQAVTVPTGYTKAYQTVLEDANNEGYWQKEQSVGAGQSVNLDLWLRKSASMAYLPRVQVFLKRSTDPFAGGTPLKTFTMTDSVDTFEQDTYTYSNDGAEDETLVIRFLGKNASGNLFSALTITVLNVDLTSVITHLTDIKGVGWTDENLVTIDANIDAILEDTSTTIPGTITTMQADLDDPNQYKADVSALALEATLTAMKGAGWTTETLKAIYDAIQALPEAVAVLTYNDLTYNGTGHELVSGAVVANDASDTMAYGGDAFELRPDAGVVLDVNFEFALGTSRVDELRIRARMTGNPPTAQAYANVYAYDYLAAAWTLISDASNRIPFSATLVDRTYILGASMQATDGTVKIRYLTNRTADTDILYLDFHAVEGVNTGVTVGEIAEGIWAHNIRNRALDGTHRSAGYFLSRTQPNWATVDTVVGADVTFSANDYLQEDDHIYANRTIQFHKAGEYIYEIRKCVDNIGRVFTLDQAPLLVDGSTWHAYMLPEISEDVSNLDVAVSTRAPANEYDTELTDLQTDITTIVTDYARRTGDYAPANEYDAELLALQADITAIVTDYARRVGDYAPPNEYDAELLALQADITTIVTDYARRTGDYAIPNEYDAELLALQTDITTIVTDYARRVGDYAPPNEYDADITGIRNVTDQFVFTIANQVDANALTGGGGATAGEVRIEMDANSTRLADIQERTDRIPNIPAPADEYDAEFALLQGNITTILADYARRTGDYAVPNEYDAALAVIAGNVATILIDYARRTGDYAPANEYDVELAAIQALIEALMGVGWVDETLVEIMNEILGLGPVGTALLENRIASLILALQHNTALTRYMRTDQIEIRRSSDVDFTLRGLTPLEGRTKLYFTVKEMKEKDTATDAQSIIQLEETAGLLRINKAPATAAHGALTVTDAVAGIVNITIDAIETDKLTPNQMYCYDVKMDNIILSEGKFMVTTAITRTIT